MEYVESERKTEKKKDQTERLIKLDSKYTEDRQILRHAQSSKYIELEEYKRNIRCN